MPTIVVLCAGYATRMGTLTSNTAKAMLQFSGKPYLDWLLRFLKPEFEKVILCVGHNSSAIIERYHDTVGLEIIEQPQPLLETGGAIRFIAGLLKEQHFFVCNGDTLCNYIPSKAYDFHLSHSKPITMVVSRRSNQNMGKVRMNRQQLIVSQDEFIANLDERTSASGIFILDRQFIIDTVPENQKLNFSDNLVPLYCKKQQIMGFEAQSEIIDFGTPAQYNHYKKINMEAFYGI